MRICHRILVALGLVVVVACSPATTEQSRISHPENKIDAIVAVRETDATVSTPTVIHLACKGCPISGNPFWIADNVQDLQVLWIDAGHLKISASNARVFQSDLHVEFPGGAGINVHYEIAAQNRL